MPVNINEPPNAAADNGRVAQSTAIYRRIRAESGVNRSAMGSWAPMSTAAATRRTLAPLAIVTVAAFLFALLLILVRLQWAPLESADHRAAAGLNSLVAGHAAVVSVVKAVTWLGSSGVLWTVTGTAAVVLAIRRRWRLAVYLLVAGAGALTLDPVLKSLVGRLRPVVAHPVAYGTGDSFPSGHALGSIVCYGALFLVFLPATRGKWRRLFTVVIAALIVAIGASRLLLGVHFISDVLGGWALGITWLGVTAFAFELSRQAAGAPAADPMTEGLEPEARTDLLPAEPETRPWTMTAPDRYGRIAAGDRGDLGADRRRPHRHRQADHDHPQRERRPARRPDDPALVPRAPHAVAEPLEPGRQQPRGHPGHPHRQRGGLRRLPRRHPPLAAGDLHRRGHVRRTGCLPDHRGNRQAPAARRSPP